MNKINRLTELISEADKKYEQSIINVLDEIIPGLNTHLKHEIVQNICYYRYRYDSIDEIVLMSDDKPFDNPVLADILAERIQKIREGNKGMKPNIDERYWCKTCGSRSHEGDPYTGYCFNCDTDNWEPETL